MIRYYEFEENIIINNQQISGCILNKLSEGNYYM